MNPVRPLREAVAQAFGRAAADYDAHARVQQRLAARLQARLPAALARDTGARVLDLGCGTGYCLPDLQRAYPQAQVLGLDLAAGMLAFARARHGDGFGWICAAAEQMPLPDASVDLVFSNLAIQWCEDFPALLAEVRRVLRPGGRFLATTLAAGTLREIELAWAQVDGLPHVQRFPPEQGLLEDVARCGLRVHAAHCHDEVAWYSDLRGLVDSLKRVGAHNMQHSRPGLGGRRAVQAWSEAMAGFRTPQGLPARYRVLLLDLERPPGPMAGP